MLRGESWDLAQHCANGPAWTWDGIGHNIVAVFDPRCYAYSDAAWGEMAQFKTPPVPPAIGAPTGAALTQPPADGGSAQATIDRLIQDQSTAWKALNLDFFRNQPKVPAGDDNSTLWLLAAGAAAAAALLLIARR